MMQPDEKHVLDDSSNLEVAMNSRATSFLDLPAEIRNVVYQIALKDVPMLVPESPEKTSHTVSAGLREPALLAVNRQVRSEMKATPVFYGNNTFEASWSAQAGEFLLQLGPERARMLRHLRAYSITVVLFTDRAVWLDTVLRATKRLLKLFPGYLHKDALLVPLLEGRDVVWKRLVEIEEFEIMGGTYAWSIWSKSELELKSWRQRCKDWANEELGKR